MTQTTHDCFFLSAHTVMTFMKCPTCYRLAHREGLQPAGETDAQRIGTHWHALHEVYRNTWEGLDHPEIGTAEQRQEQCMEAVIQHLNDRYANRVPTKDPEEWDLERQVLLTCFVAYLWYYQEDEIDYVQQELPFTLPLHSPRTGLPLSTKEVLRVGKIDHLVNWRGMIGSIERKSTTRGIEAGSDYWQRSQKDTQVSMYALALRDLVAAGTIALPADCDASRFGNTLYDVWRRPTIKPAKLTQAGTAAFIESKTYLGETFEVQVDVATYSEGETESTCTRVWVDGVEAEVEVGKKGFAIRETVSMFCARLMADICERPDFYFQRREIARTEKELQKFRGTLWNIYQAQKNMDRTGTWFENEQQCRATFPCQYIPICYGPGAEAVCDGTTIPQGFKREFVYPTIHGIVIAED